MISRQKIAKKRSLQKVNEHFERFSNDESAKKTSAAQVLGIFQRIPNSRPTVRL